MITVSPIAWGKASDSLFAVYKKKLTYLNPFPAVKRFWLTVKNQKLVIHGDGQRLFLKDITPAWLHINSSSLSSQKNEGIRFGTFLHDKTLLYVRAGFEANTLKSVRRTPWDATPLGLMTLKRSINPGLGIEWNQGHFSISGEYRAYIASKSLNNPSLKGLETNNNKVTNSLLLQARYKFGDDKPFIAKKRK